VPENVGFLIDRKLGMPQPAPFPDVGKSLDVVGSFGRTGTDVETDTFWQGRGSIYRVGFVGRQFFGKMTTCQVIQSMVPGAGKEKIPAPIPDRQMDDSA
jgi:hypothetical protein